MDGLKVVEDIDKIYNQIVHWRHNLFKIPSGKYGKAFVDEMARLFNSYAKASSMEGVAIKAAMVFPVLVLQKPFKSSRSKDHSKCIERRLKDWQAGQFISLFEEAKSIQSRLNATTAFQQRKARARRFTDLMMMGKVRAATRLISEENQAGMLPLNETIGDKTVRDILHEKHPSARPLVATTSPPPMRNPFPTHPALFDEINGLTILRSALSTEGGAGPSGVDACLWRRMCCSFQSASCNLREALAGTARRICSSFVDPEPLKPLTACRLIALDKCPGVRPIGIGEVSRRIISKAILTVINADIQEVVGCYQLCVGQASGCEAAIHALGKLFEKDTTEGVLLVDASNAFNNLNRKATLMNVQRICPSFAAILTNTYRSDPTLFIDGETILSSEGTTQGDPLAMAMYAIGTLPLILRLQHEADQIWYADDSSAGGTIKSLKGWWDKLQRLGPDYGYFVNPSKSLIIAKKECLAEAESTFQDTGIHTSSSGGSYLGSVIGDNSFKEIFVQKKVKQWTSELECLADIAASQPQAAYAALTFSMRHKWTFLARTTKDISTLLQPVEDVIRHKVIPAIIGKQAISDADRELFALPVKLGGLGIPILSDIASRESANSTVMTEPLVKSIMRMTDESDNIKAQQMNARKQVRETNKQRDKAKMEETLSSLNDTTRKAALMAQEKGASAWLGTLPIEEHGFILHKGAFRDAIALRYGWQPNGMSTLCLCGKANNVQHALSCTKGGLPIHRHNDIRDLTASLMEEVSTSTEREPALQPLSGEVLYGRSSNTQDDSRVDIRCRGFWNSQQDAFFDVRVFNPMASSNRTTSLISTFTRHEREKRRMYDQCIREVEHGSFTPLVFSASGGMGPSTTIAYKRLAALLATKRGQSYSLVMRWLRCRLSFSLLRSAIAAIRGSRNSSIKCLATQQIDLAAAEGQIPLA